MTTKDEIKNRISMALKDPILQQGFEIICKENAELKTQIEKMKCCQNCKNEGEDYYGNSCCRINESFWNCDKWEIKE